MLQYYSLNLCAIQSSVEKIGILNSMKSEDVAQKMIDDALDLTSSLNITLALS